MCTLCAMQKQRTVIYFNPDELGALQKLSQQSGAPIAELVRRAVRAWLKLNKKGDK